MGTFSKFLGKRLVGSVVGIALVMGAVVAPASHALAGTSGVTTNATYTASSNKVQTVSVTINGATVVLGFNSNSKNGYHDSIQPGDKIVITSFPDGTFSVTITSSLGVPRTNFTKAPIRIAFAGHNLERYEPGVPGADPVTGYKKINKVIQYPGMYKFY